MKTLHRRCAGLDVHSDSVVVCARLTVRTKASHEVRRFSTTTRDLLELGDWLAAQGITHVAMEATGVYWKPIWQILEGRFELVLANAAHIRNVPGRKSDVNDAQWLQQLHQYGLLRGSFRPREALARLRAILRHRERMVDYAASHIQHMQKALMQMNVQLHHVVSDITGLTGMQIIRAICQGARDPEALAQNFATVDARPPKTRSARR